MIKIPEEEIKFDPTSYVDPSGKVFIWRREIYRAISPDRTDHFERLMKESVFKNLQEEGMVVQTEQTEYALSNFGLVLRHKKIEPITYCFEWPPEMLKDAAILILKVCIELIREGLVLQDAYPWNIQFTNARPVLIDVGSIARPTRDILWEAYQEFCNFFLYPLYLYSLDLYDVTRPLLLDYLNGISDEKCYSLLPFGSKFLRRGPFCRLAFPLLMGNMVRRLGLERKVHIWAKLAGSKAVLSDIRLRFFEDLLGDVDSIKLPVRKTKWFSYYSEGSSRFLPPDQNSKGKAVSDIIDKLKPESVLDIACNIGWYSMLAAEKGARVMSFDRDVGCISSLYDNAKRRRLNITPIVMDLLNPSPQFGWCLKQFSSAQDRYKADMCFAFAIIHHAVFGQWQDFNRFIEAVDIFVKKWALIEFVPKDDEKAQLLLSRKQDTFQWYTMDNFLESLRRKYSIECVCDSFPLGRKMILCKKT